MNKLRLLLISILTIASLNATTITGQGYGNDERDSLQDF